MRGNTHQNKKSNERAKNTLNFSVEHKGNTAKNLKQNHVNDVYHTLLEVQSGLSKVHLEDN